MAKPPIEKYTMSQREELLTRIETKEAIVGIRRDGIIHVYYKSGTVITIPLQEKMLKIFLQLTEGEHMPFIWEGGYNVRVTKEARLNASIMEKDAPCEASVIVVKNWYQRIMAEFYYKVNRPGMIYKVTGDFGKGIRWLHMVHEDAML
jgi:hypothetical protein